MNSSARLAEIVDSVKAAYGSLDSPNYGFQETRYESLRRHPFVADLMCRSFVRDETDLNDHASLHLHVLHDSGSVMVCLSLVGSWAMVFRLAEENPVYTDVVDPQSPVSPPEKEVLDLLQRHGFVLVSKAEASAPLDMNLFHTDRPEVRVYHAIISDDGIIPAVLLKGER